MRNHRCSGLWVTGCCLYFVMVVAVVVDAIEHFRAIDVWNAVARRRQQRHVRGGVDPDSRPEDNDTGENDTVQELFLTQRLAHFHGANTNQTFAQRYFYSNRLERSSSDAVDEQQRPQPQTTVRRNHNTKDNKMHNIAFVCIGGEGPALSRHVLIDSVHCSGDMLETAQRLYDTYSDVSISLYALEHRYYGDSYPVFPSDTASSSSPVTNENLVYLSSLQAAADVEYFIRSVAGQSRNNNNNNSVILFGGSYPGMLAAFAATTFPSHITGAVSNSAPVQAVLDFAAYHNHVASVLPTDTCRQVMQIGHATLVERVYAPLLLRTTGTTASRTVAPSVSGSNNNNNNATLQHLAEQFGLCDWQSLLSIRNVQMWLGDGVFDLGTQGNDPSCVEDYCNLEKKCDSLVQFYEESLAHQNHHRDPKAAAVQALADMVRVLNNDGDIDSSDDQNGMDDCIELDWEGMVQYIADPVQGKDGGLRSWLWQTCTEFGFYQTCERNSTCPYGRGAHPLSQDLELCQRAFGIGHAITGPDGEFKGYDSTVAENVQATNGWTGGWHLADYDGKVLSVTGSVDPWSELAIEKSHKGLNKKVYRVPGASHHFWTHPVQETDGPTIQAARQHIHDVVHDWLFPEPESISVVPAVV